jgi:hypothetical protein
MHYLGPVCVKHTAVAVLTTHHIPDLVLTKDFVRLINHAITQFHSGLIELVDWFISEFMLEPPGTMSKDQCLGYMVNRRRELLNSSEENWLQYFLHGKVFNVDLNCDKLLVFGNETLEKIYLLHFYTSAYTPLRKERFLTELNMTTPHMFSHVAVGVSHRYSRVHRINYLFMIFRQSVVSTKL